MVHLRSHSTWGTFKEALLYIQSHSTWGTFKEAFLYIQSHGTWVHLRKSNILNAFIYYIPYQMRFIKK